MVSALGRFLYPVMPAKRLAMLRILVGLYGLIYVISRFVALTSVVRYPASQFRPVGLATLLTDPLPGGLVRVSVIVTIVAGIAFVAGWRHRFSGPLYAFGLLWVTSYRNSWGMVFHTENLLVLHTLVLGLSPAADAWSVDARGKDVPEDSGRYGWAVLLMCAVAAAAYFLAGYTKLTNSGFGWVWSDTLRNYIAFDNVRKAELGAGYSAIGTLLVRHEWIFPPMAAVSLAVELGAPFALLSRRLGQLWVAAAWGFHLGVLVLMFIMFHYPLIGVAFAPFFDVERLGERIAKTIKARRG